MKREKIIDENYLHFLYDKMVVSNAFPWFFTDKTTHTFTKYANPLDFSWSHILFNAESNNSNYSDLFYPSIIQILSSYGYDIKNVYLIRARLGMITNVGSNLIHNPHVDHYFDHKTILFYFNDSDGDTILYKEKFKKGMEGIILDRNDLMVDYTNKPSKNTAILFDGLTYHSSSCPTLNDIRITLNINFIEK